MVYKIRDISRYVINFAFETNRSVTNLKLQKILYFLYGFYYFVTKDELFDEEFEAWAYGPVVRKSYVDYSMFGAEIIPPHNNYINFLFDEDHDYDSKKIKITLILFLVKIQKNNRHNFKHSIK